MNSNLKEEQLIIKKLYYKKSSILSENFLDFVEETCIFNSLGALSREMDTDSNVSFIAH